MKEEIKIDDEYSKEEELRIEEEMKKTQRKIGIGFAIAVAILFIAIFLAFTKSSRILDIMNGM